MLEKTKQIKFGYMQATKVELIVNLRLPEINPPKSPFAKGDER